MPRSREQISTQHSRFMPRIFLVVLAAFTVFVLFDTFALARVQSSAQEADTSNIVHTSQKTVDEEQVAKTSEAVEDVSDTTHTAHETIDTTQIAHVSGAVEVGSYSDENMQITVSSLRAYDTDIYIADVQVSSAEYLKAAFAQGAFGRNIKQSTSAIASQNNAILAINGDYYGFRDNGYVVRNGVLYRDTAASGTDALVVYGDGRMAAISQDEVSAQDLLDTGAWQVFSFGPVLMQDGSVAVGQGDEVGQAMKSNPRTAIGMVDALHYIVVVSDGRTNANAGLSLYELACVMQDAGATFAYNLDGGGSTTMYFDGEVINNPSSGHRSGEREVSDIVYFG